MITSILEFFFTNHYYKDSDNRFLTRIKNAKLLNKFNDPALANKRFKMAMYSMALGDLDKMQSAVNPIGVVFGNIFFKENGKIQQAIIENDDNKRQGGAYVAYVADGNVITIMLIPPTITNQEIADQLEKHDGIPVKQLIDIRTKAVLNLNDKKRTPIIIDLNMPEAEFVKEYPAPQLKNNPWNIGVTGLSPVEMEEIERLSKLKTEEVQFSIKAIDSDKVAQVKDLIKEYTIGEGQTILVPYADGPKEKTIRKIVIDEKGDKRKYYLEFEKTAKLFELAPGTNFIISPKVKNEKYLLLLKMFGLSEDQFMNFQGKITSVSYYKKERFADNKHKLGILIDPKFYF